MRHSSFLCRSPSTMPDPFIIFIGGVNGDSLLPPLLRGRRRLCTALCSQSRQQTVLRIHQVRAFGCCPSCSSRASRASEISELHGACAATIHSRYTPSSACRQAITFAMAAALVRLWRRLFARSPGA